MRVRILYHDHCFDGAASAAYFSRFYKEKVRQDAEFEYTGLAHKASQLFEDSLFDGEENAIVDFKYSTHPNLTWWFDHHQSAFLSQQDAEHFQRDTSGKKLFDPTYRSCTKFIANFTREKYGYDPADLKDLVHWADIIDGAQYESAEQAVKLGAPAMQLVLVIEAAKGSGAVHKIIRMMRTSTLDEIINDPEIQELYKPLYERHLKSIDIIRRESNLEKGVLFFDLIEDGLEGYNKFIPYYLFPDTIYTVSVSKSSFRTKVSVGSNPWAGQALKHNLATICERYGGGGHAKVGAISFEPGAIEQARQAAREVVAELQT
jgi:hypothetical protein